jgi:cell wall-associated NlpC family hydrolase
VAIPSSDTSSSSSSLQVKWTGDFVGIPYKRRGSNFSGCDCWGLVRLVYLYQCGIELPSYADKLDDISASETMNSETRAGSWLQVMGRPKPFDVVHMTSYPIIDGRRIKTNGHCGVMISPERLLHVWEENPSYSVHVSIDNPRIRPRVLGIYRHRELA